MAAAPLVMPLAAAADESAAGCGYAAPGTGAYAETLCWLDFSVGGAPLTTEYRSTGNNTYASVLGAAYGSVTSASQLTSANGKLYGNVSNYPLTVTLSGGYELTANLSITGSNAAGRVVSGHSFPTWGGAFLGNAGFYSGVAGNPALYQSGNGGQTTVTLSQITLTSAGVATKGYSMVVADSETTDSGEEISWSRQGGTNFAWLPNTPGATTQAGTMGNACPAAFTPAINGTATTASCAANTSSTKTGTPMLQVSPSATGSTPFSITTTMKGSGLQGTAFGIIIARAQATVAVADRIVGTDGTTPDSTDFGVTMTSAPAVWTGAVSTSATNGGVPLLVQAGGTPVTFGTSTSSGGLSGSYTAAWQCYKTDPNSSSRIWWPSATTTSATPPPSTSNGFSRVSAGQFLQCTVTYTPPYITLVKTVVNGSTGATSVPADWTLTGAGSSSVAVGTGQGKKTPVAVGAYALSEAGPANPWVHGYAWTGLTCTADAGSTSGWSLTTTAGTSAGTISAGRLTLAKGNSVTCTYTNTAYPKTTLTLIAESQGSAPATSWTLSATGAAGSLPGPVGVSGAPGATAIAVTPASAYQLAAGAGPAQYTPSTWTCVDQNNASITVGTAGAVTLTRGTQATCRIVYSTARITLLKHVVSSGLTPGDWTITATPQSFPGLTSVSAVGAESAAPANTFEVRPGHVYTLAEALTDPQSALAYRQRSLQRYENGTWVTLSSSQITAPAAGASATYRFVNDRPPAITLPLTGGASADAFTIVGAGALALALLASTWVWLRRRRAA